MTSPNLLNSFWNTRKIWSLLAITDCYRMQKKPKYMRFPGKSQNKLNSQRHTMLVYVSEWYTELLNLSLSLALSLSLSLSLYLSIYLCLSISLSLSQSSFYTSTHITMFASWNVTSAITYNSLVRHAYLSSEESFYSRSFAHKKIGTTVHCRLLFWAQ